jgi:hypothetical protein
VVVPPFEESFDKDDKHVSFLERQTQSHTCAKKLASGNKMSMDVYVCKGGKTNPQIVAHKEVSLLVDACNPCPNLMVVNKTRYLLVLNVNGLLCATQHE